MPGDEVDTSHQNALEDAPEVKLGISCRQFRLCDCADDAPELSLTITIFSTPEIAPHPAFQFSQ